MKYYGFLALLTLVSHFAFITLAFVSIQSLRLDRWITPGRQRYFNILLVMLAITIGYTCSSFFLSFVDNVRNLTYLLSL
ncbi:hypothetical protein FD15_GL001328 [Liquorilactobacillus sucicola DSM 21376 = JCM 15457]|uniref:DUF1146 domain-containing protein n=1 Tax=Liquorilactobacillus sucicola DSM 21376 = JCM 15457 TaxID=1423806 RepID=A0A0R2DRI1_9LACO|nr:DUF1146 family protein [Liquorilactobacillus sucicola]KRN06134.1 hypothetical protein FD15_GL001328 [Liquorilactobacillus sucicola DSM 21376 = JCM 15457]